MFDKNDLNQIQAKGIDLETIENQIEKFIKGFPFTNLVKPAIIGNGIEKLSENSINDLVKYYEGTCHDHDIIKFVPASGAASRMFKNLFNFLERESTSSEFFEDKSFNSVNNFIHRIKDFAFYEDLKEALLMDGFDLEEKLSSKEFSVIIEYLLSDKGLDYGKLPKGLLKFHRYEHSNRVALEEHLVEAAKYGVSKNKKAFVHFTVSPEHLEKFKTQVDQVKDEYEKLFDITFDISYSVQKSSTDMIAVEMNNEPFREKDGQLLFRPGGHGALIENLNDLEADLIFIKNIDNVVPDRLKEITTIYKKVIGGLLLKLQSKTFKFLKELEKSESTNLIEKIEAFAQSDLNIKTPTGFNELDPDEKKSFLFHHLNRPIRICGMVKNKGEPGGGPFWVKNSKGEVSLQVVESSQVNASDEEQMKILQSSTHFNPVDLVCGTRNYKGESFDLHEFIDPETGFISIKSKDGKNLKAQELPGLWNGAMADWITIFVEVPIITFNPVKTVNDLLRPQHQPS